MTNRALVVITALTSTVLASASAVSAQTRDAEAIARGVERALGWTDRFEKVHALKIEGAIDGAPITVWAKQPSLFRMELDAGKDHIVQAYDGSFGWQRITGEHPQDAAALKGAQLDSIVNQGLNAIGGPLVHAPERGTVLTLEGDETVDGKSCYKLRLDLVTKMVIHVWIDKATSLEIQEELLPAGGNTIEETVGDYKTFDGIRFPCRFVSGTKGEAKKFEFLISKITVNPDLQDGFFTLPRK